MSTTTCFFLCFFFFDASNSDPGLLDGLCLLCFLEVLDSGASRSSFASNSLPLDDGLGRASDEVEDDEDDDDDEDDEEDEDEEDDDLLPLFSCVCFALGDGTGREGG
jgi:hypothetical protein